MTFSRRADAFIPSDLRNESETKSKQPFQPSAPLAFAAVRADVPAVRQVAETRGLPGAVP